tara:strand:- start:255 stop:869 length:615 start_codon:yes stop_codon:yes gene_type:complete
MTTEEKIKTMAAKKLPYDRNELHPAISEETIDYHYDKHHLGYLAKLNKLIAPTIEYANKTLEEIIRKAHSKGDLEIFNNAAQAWNHDFYWQSLSRGKKRPANITLLINKYFDGFDTFNNEMIERGLSLFGSGWVWLVQDKITKALRILSTHNADNPLTLEVNPLVTIDVWEHAYYVDYRNNRKAYLTNIVKYINWDFAEKNLIN